MTIARSIASGIARSIGSSLDGASAGGAADPLITLQPVDAVVAIDDDAVFTIDAEGTEPITYQWFEFKV